MLREATVLSKVKTKKKRKSLESYNNYGYIFLLPFFLVFLIFNLYPTLYTILLSFTDLSGWNTEFKLVGIQNFINLFNNALFLKALTNTLILWTMNFIPQIVLAMILAFWFSNKRLNLKGTGFFKTIFYLPNIITAASVALIFYSLFSYPAGPLNMLLLKFGVLDDPIDFFRSVMGTRLIVSFIQFWMWYGQTTIVLLAGILSIDESLFEAARIDGANDMAVFKNITLPLLKPITLYVLITSLIGGLQIFDIPLLLTNGAPNNSVETLMTFVYKQAFQGSRSLNIASAGSVVLLVISIVFSLCIFRSFKEKKVN